MKEKLHTIPVNEAFESGDECPFCYLYRQTEHRAIRYVAGPGASYMEPDVRYQTNQRGFCPNHMKKLYDFGNVLGNSLMLQSHFDELLQELHENIRSGKPERKQGLFRKAKPQEGELYWERLEKRVGQCYICDSVADSMARYYATFFHLTREPEFREKAERSKGFCLPHLAKLLELAPEKLPEKQRDWFYDTLLPKAEEELIRVKKELDWLIAKFDYRNAGADWGNSRDALPRTMQKLAGIYPADPPYRDE